MSSTTGQTPEFVAMVGSIQSTFGPILQVNQTSYTIMSGDVSAGFALIPVVWDVPFIDTNYVTVTGIYHQNERAANDYSPGDVHDITATGFKSYIYVNSSSAMAGDVVVLQTLGIHK